MTDDNAESRASPLDASHVSPWTFRQKLARALWMLLGAPLARHLPGSPLRLAVLSLFGARVGRFVHLDPNVRVEIPWNLSLGDHARVAHHAILYSLGSISIGEHASIDPFAHLCAGSHDYRLASMPLLRPAITIGPHACVATGAFVGPGVTLGHHAVLTERSATFKDLPPLAIATGHPAAVVSTRDLPSP